jgi:hypothetical protein
MKKIILLFFFCLNAWALGMDEKLTLRVLSVSNSKKTILINRGLEDGLVVGDHAKFFLTAGVIARGVVAKASPSRSVWSLYRVVDDSQIAADTVMNLKIATPVKISDDPSKSLGMESTEAGNDKISLAEGANDLLKEATDEEKSEMDDLKKTAEVDSEDEIIIADEEKPVKNEQISKQNKTKKIKNEESSEESVPMISSSPRGRFSDDRLLEAFGTLYLSALSTTSTVSGVNVSGKSSGVDFSLGLEKYFADRASWYHQLSLYLMVHKSSQTTTSLSGIEAASDALMFGVGASYHFNSPFLRQTPIWFLTSSLGIGNCSDTQAIATTSSTAETTLSGSAQYFNIGVGVKYAFGEQLSLRSTFDYYRRSELYQETSETTTSDNTDNSYSKVVSGPRIQFGLAYRW